MLGAKFDLVGDYAMVKGLPWSLRLTRKAGPGKTPVDLTGCTARLAIKDVLSSTVPDEFSTAGGHVVLGGVAGTIDIDLPETVTDLAAVRASYRLYLTPPGGKEILLLRGRLALVEED